MGLEVIADVSNEGVALSVTIAAAGTSTVTVMLSAPHARVAIDVTMPRTASADLTAHHPEDECADTTDTRSSMSTSGHKW